MVEKIKNKLVFIGRLEKDTGLLKLLSYLKNKKYNVYFIGDGSLRDRCSKYGEVKGFCDPTPFLKSAEYCVPGGYLSYIEALKYKCKVLVFSDNKLKKDYWDEIMKIKSFPSWDKIADEYISLYNNIK